MNVITIIIIIIIIVVGVICINFICNSQPDALRIFSQLAIKNKKIYLTNSSPRISEDPAVTIPHSISGLGSTPRVSYTVDSIQNLILPTISSKVEDQPRSGRVQHDSYSS